MKYLFVGLGNMGEKYVATRHNVGFQLVDNFADKYDGEFTLKRYGNIANIKLKGKLIKLLKPSTYVNLSGKAISYWLQKKKISTANLLILVDDIALPFGEVRLRNQGGNAGHRGLVHIEETLGHQNYPRLRFGIGSTFNYGQQVDYVLGNWSNKELTELPKIIDYSIEIMESFVLIGCQRTMNLYNKKQLSKEG